MYRLFVLVVLFVGVFGYDEDSPLSINKCQRITVPLCSDVPYNYTRLPNMLGHRDQERVAMDVQHFEPLVHTGCSQHVKFFVCSIYTPMCSENVEVPVTSCRTVCEEVKNSCMTILTKFGLHWPEMLNCSNFPKRGELCMEPAIHGQAQSTHTNPTSDNTNTAHGIGGSHMQPAGGNRLFGPLSGTKVSDAVVHASSRCPSDMLDLAEANVESAVCYTKCNASLMFRSEHKHFAELWMGVWSVICCVITAFTVFTYLLDSNRFRFPEKSIVYLAGCYHFYSWVYVLRAFIISPSSIACTADPKTGQWYLVANGLDSPVCALTFIVLYYFSMASSLWWVVLTFTWFLAAGRKWAIEMIDGYSSYFHFVAWGTPALLSIAVLINQKVDASELTSVCFVGANDWRALAGYVVAPLFIMLLVGCGLILAGFYGSYSVRRELIGRRIPDVYRFEKLIVKVAVFSVLYVVPAVCVLGCYAYHAYVLMQWEPSSTRYIQCKATAKDPSVCDRRPQLPQVELYMLNIFMCLIVGITSGMWVMSGKTCVTWQRFICCAMRSPDTKQVQQQMHLQSQPQSQCLPQGTNPQQQAMMPLMHNYQQHNNVLLSQQSQQPPLSHRPYANELTTSSYVNSQRYPVAHNMRYQYGPHNDASKL